MSIENVFALVLVAATTAMTYAMGRRLLNLTNGSLARALERSMECLGACVLFLGINVVVGVALILLIRSATPRFIPVYAVQDDMVLIVSIIQGVVFRLWWRPE